MNQSKPPRAAIAGLVIVACTVLLGLLGGVLLSNPKHNKLQSGTLLDRPRPVAPFTLTGDDGQPLTRDDLSGHWTVLFAGYTFCPDVCPTTLAAVRAARDKLGDRAAQIHVLFLSVDPDRDTPDRLHTYVRYFAPDFRGATGNLETLQSMGNNLGFVFEKAPSPGGGGYLVDHSAALMLIDPQNRLAGYLTPPFEADKLAADFQRLLDSTP